MAISVDGKTGAVILEHAGEKHKALLAVTANTVYRLQGIDDTLQGSQPTLIPESAVPNARGHFQLHAAAFNHPNKAIPRGATVTTSPLKELVFPNGLVADVNAPALLQINRNFLMDNAGNAAVKIRTRNSVYSLIPSGTEPSIDVQDAFYDPNHLVIVGNLSNIGEAGHVPVKTSRVVEITMQDGSRIIPHPRSALITGSLIEGTRLRYDETRRFDPRGRNIPEIKLG